MRTLLIFLGAFVFAVASNAQKAADIVVPAAVSQALKAKFPAAAEPKWDLKKDLYKASFKIDKRAHDVWFDKGGVLKKHKEDFPKSELPKAILIKLEKDFKAYKIDDADKIEENGEVSYLVKLDGTPEDRKVLFSASGEVKKNDVAKKKDED